jgi:3-phosphoshikimate 1-carboxyvinyltransferase
LNISIHKPVSSVSGNIYLPGSKSISNRVLIIKTLSGLNFEIGNLSDSDDTTHLQKALEVIQKNNSGIIHVGHAGTDMRFLAGFLACGNGSFELTGSERMLQRPIGELVDVLNGLGADITYINEKGFPPLLIKGKTIEGGKATIKGNISSQFITSLLLIAPYFANGLELSLTGEIVSFPYIKMTLEIMKEFGAAVEWEENKITVKPVPYSYHKNSYTIESDWSAASYYYSIAALSEINTGITLNGVFKNSLQADAVCETIYRTLGVSTEFHDDGITITKTGHVSTDVLEYDLINCPDIAQTLSCTCIGLNKAFYFTGLQTLKIKETDRIVALKNELKKCGFEIFATNNSIQFEGKTTTDAHSEIVITTYNDHRMAMSFAPLCLVFDELVIEDADVVSKSYPEFWKDLGTIGFIIKEK